MRRRLRHLPCSALLLTLLARPRSGRGRGRCHRGVPLHGRAVHGDQRDDDVAASSGRRCGCTTTPREVPRIYAVDAATCRHAGHGHDRRHRGARHRGHRLRVGTARAVQCCGSPTSATTGTPGRRCVCTGPRAQGPAGPDRRRLVRTGSRTPIVRTTRRRCSPTPNSTRLWMVTRQLAHGSLYALPQAVVDGPGERRHAGCAPRADSSPTGPSARTGVATCCATTSMRWSTRGLPPGPQQQRVYLPFQLQGEAITWTAGRPRTARRRGAG